MEGEKTRIIEREQSGKREREGWRESKIKKIVSEKNLLVETKYWLQDVNQDLENFHYYLLAHLNPKTPLQTWYITENTVF